MSKRTKNRLELASEAWKVMTDGQRDRFLDFLYRLVIKREKFTDNEIIQLARGV